MDWAARKFTDNKLTFFHGGGSKQLHQFAGKMVKDLIP
jgi:hypothetical protein